MTELLFITTLAAISIASCAGIYLMLDLGVIYFEVFKELHKEARDKNGKPLT